MGGENHPCFANGMITDKKIMRNKNKNNLDCCVHFPTTKQLFQL